MRAELLRKARFQNSTWKKSLPDVPTITQAGVNVPPLRFWTGLLVKAGTPKPVIDRRYKAFATAAVQPSVIEQLAATGVVVSPRQDAQELRQRISTEAAAMGKPAQQLDLKMN